MDATLYCKLCKKKFEDEIALEKHTAKHKENKNNVQNYDNTGKLPNKVGIFLQFRKTIRGDLV